MQTNAGAIVPGSLGDVSRNSHMSVSEAFLLASVVVLVDVSGSMTATDTQDGISRYDAACRELATLQRANPGKLAIVQFSGSPAFIPGGVPTLDGGTTALAEALQFVAFADGTVDFIVISDGQPDDEHAALAAVKGWTSPISTIYVGPPDGPGESFLARLAQKHGGRHARVGDAGNLASAAQAMLPA